MTPYRSECSRCADIERDLEAAKTVLAEAKKDRWYENAKHYGGLICAIVGVSMFGTMIHAAIVAPPAPAGPCADSVEIISIGDSVRKCDPGAVLTTEKENGDNIIVRCHCGNTSADAGAE